MIELVVILLTAIFGFAFVDAIMLLVAAGLCCLWNEAMKQNNKGEGQ